MASYGSARRPRAFADTKKFWGVLQTWKHFAAPLTGFVIGTAIKMRYGDKAFFDAALTGLLWAICFYCVAWVGTFLFHFIWLSPAALHKEERERADAAQTRERALQTELSQVRAELSTERQKAGKRANLEAENAGLRKQVELPRLVPEIRQVRFAEAEPVSLKEMLNKASLIAAGQFKHDTALLAYVIINNEHRVPSTATCSLRIRDRFRAEPTAVEGLVAQVTSYPLIDLTKPIEFAQPRSGWLHFRVRMKSGEDLIGARIILSVTDGTGAISTAETEVS